MLRYLVRRCYATYQEKKSTRINVSNKKKKSSITIINRIRRLFLSSSAAVAAYKVVDVDDDGSMSSHVEQYYDINNNHNQSLQRRGVTVNPLHQAQDIDTTDIRAHMPMNV